MSTRTGAFLCALVLATSACSGFAADLFWTGNGATRLFGTPENWNPVQKPQNYDTLRFPFTGVDVTVTNDLDNLTLSGLRFDNNCTIYGNTLGITNGIESSSATALAFNAKIECPLNIVGNQAFDIEQGESLTIDGGLNLSGNLDLKGVGGSAQIPCVTSGTGNITDDIGEVLHFGTTQANTFVGSLTVNNFATTVLLASPQPFGPNGTVIVNAGALSMSNLTIIGSQLLVPSGGNAYLYGAKACSWTGPITITDSNSFLTVDMTTSNTFFLSGVIGGSGWFYCTGSNEVQITGTSANTFIGTTVAQCPLLTLAKTGGARALGGFLQVPSDGVSANEVRWMGNYEASNIVVSASQGAYINVNGLNESFGNIYMGGATLNTGTGQANLYGAVTINYGPGNTTFTGHIGLPNGVLNNPLIIQDYDATLDIYAVITGAGTLDKQGPGTLTLDGANNYTGLTILEDGITECFSATALGTADSGTIVKPGATLSMRQGVATVTEQIILSGNGYQDTNGALRVTGNLTLQTLSPSIYPPISLTSNSTINVEPSAAQLMVNGFISGTGPLKKNGAGTMQFGGSQANTYSGTTVISNGTFNLSKPFGVITVPGDLVIGPPPSGSAYVMMYQGGLIGGSTVTVNGGGIWNLNGYSQGGNLSHLILNDGGGVQTGVGVLGFASGGLITVGSIGNFGAHSSAFITGNVSFTDNDSLTLDVATHSLLPPFPPDAELVITANISSGGSTQFIPSFLTKTGAGQARLSGNNSIPGNISVNGGTIIVSNPNSLNSTNGHTYVNNYATLALDSGMTISNEFLQINSTNPAALDIRAGSSTWTGTIELDAPSNSINVASGAALTASGVIQGSGIFAKNGPGALTFAGRSANTYSNDTWVNSGTLTVQKGQLGLAGIPGHAFVGTGPGGPAALVEATERGIVRSITVNDGSTFYENFDDSFDITTSQGRPGLTLNGSATVVGTGWITFNAGSGIQVNPGNNTTATISCLFYWGTTGVHTINVGAGTGQTAPEFVVSGMVAESLLAPSGTQKTGAGTLRFTSTSTNICSGTNLVSAGILQIDGVCSSGTTQVGGGRLQGTGTLGVLSFVGSGGVIAPGDAGTGILTCSNFNASAGAGTLEIQLNGTTAGTGYDQLNVHGTVNLNGVTLKPSLYFTSAVSDQFTIVNNDLSDAVTGTFNGLTENKILSIGGQLFRVTYVGGTGNDVLLTHIFTPPPEQLNIEPASPTSVRLLWATNDPTYTLLYNTNLMFTNWQASTSAVAVIGTNYVVTNPIAGVQQYFELAKP